jgi:O-antigen/teichoic acid export membrane protein
MNESPDRDKPDFLRSLWTSTRHYFGNEVLSSILAMLGLVVFTRLLPPEQYGRYALAVAVGSLGLTLGVEWVQASLLRFVPIRRSERNAQAMGAAVHIAGFLGILAFTLVLLPIIFLVDPDNRIIFMMGWIYAILGAGFFIGTSFLQARMKSASFLRYRSGLAALRVIFSICFLLLFARSWNALMAGTLVAFFVLTIPLLRKERFRRPLLSIRVRASLRTLLRFGLPLSLWFIANQILNLSDRFLVEFYLGSEALGRYTVNYNLVAGLSMMALQPPLAAAYPLLVQSFGKGGRSRSNVQLSIVLDRVLLVIPPLIAGLAIYGEELLRFLFDSSYSTSALLMTLLAGGIAIWNLSLYLQKPLELEYRTRRLSAYIGLSALTNIVLNILLLPRFGMEGAAVATLVSYGVYLVLLIRTLGKGESLTIRPSTLISAVLGLSAFVIVAAIQGMSFLSVNGAVKLFLFGPLSILAYLIVLRWRGELGARR